MLWNNDIKNATLSYNGFTTLDYYTPLIRYYGNMKSIIHIIRTMIFSEEKSVQKIKGYVPHDILWNGDFDRAKKKMKYLKINLHEPSIHLFDNYLKDLTPPIFYRIFRRVNDKLSALSRSFFK